MVFWDYVIISVGVYRNPDTEWTPPVSKSLLTHLSFSWETIVSSLSLSVTCHVCNTVKQPTTLSQARINELVWSVSVSAVNYPSCLNHHHSHNTNCNAFLVSLRLSIRLLLTRIVIRPMIKKIWGQPDKYARSMWSILPYVSKQTAKNLFFIRPGFADWKIGDIN